MAEADVSGECDSYGEEVCDNRELYDECKRDCDVNSLTTIFNDACERLKTVVHLMSPAQLLEFYGFYKQATSGPCTIPRPGWYAFEAKQKWDAWNKLGDMSKIDSMNSYVQLLKKYVPDDGSNKDSAGTETLKSGWVTVSSMMSGDAHINDEDKTIFDRVKENDITKIRQLIRGRDVGSKDSEGMGLIHWAADRGNLDIIKFLIDEMNADIEMRDADGQTALHYAASCGHRDVLKYLIDKGADKNAADNDGVLPKEVASDEYTESMLS